MAEENPRRAYLRLKILHDHLQAIVRNNSPRSSTLADGLTYASAISLLDEEDEGEESRQFVPGGISQTDFRRFAPQPSLLTPQVCAQLETELKATCLAISDFWSPDDEASESEKLSLASELPAHIRAQKERIASYSSELQTRRAHVQSLIHAINETQPRLEEKLVEALTALPPKLNARRTAAASLASATIETSLLRLSILRLRTHSAIYGRTLPGADPTATMEHALRNARDSVREQKARQEVEMGALQEQLRAYEEVVGIFGRGRAGEGGFEEIVRDMAIVRRETEECRRDLRRLGWTG